MVRTADELGPVVLLAGEFEEWVRARILADYGIDFEFKSERDLFLDLDGLLEPRARLYIAEINGEPVGIGGLRPLAAQRGHALELPLVRTGGHEPEAPVERVRFVHEASTIETDRPVSERARVIDQPLKNRASHSQPAR